MYTRPGSSWPSSNSIGHMNDVTLCWAQMAREMVDNKWVHARWHVTSHSGQLSLLPSAGSEMSIGQGAVLVWRHSGNALQTLWNIHLHAQWPNKRRWAASQLHFCKEYSTHCLTTHIMTLQHCVVYNSKYLPCLSFCLATCQSQTTYKVKCVTVIINHTYNNWYLFKVAIFVITKHIEYHNSNAVKKCHNPHKNIELWRCTIVSIQVTGGSVVFTQVYFETFLIQSNKTTTTKSNSL